MTDRKPGIPGRWKANIAAEELEKMNAGQDFNIVLTRNDEPVTPGTPYNKASVLPDDLAQKICPDILDPAPRDAFESLYNSANGAKTTADAAKTAASTADGKAVAAQSAADAAKSAASTADGKAVSADTKATAAQTAANQATSKTWQISLPLNSWGGSATAGFSQTAVAAGITSTVRLAGYVLPVVSGSLSLVQKRQIKKDISCISELNSGNGNVTVMCYDGKPTQNLTVIVTEVR